MMSSSHSLCGLPLLFVSSILPNISSFIFLLCILQMRPNSPSFLRISFCMILSFSCIRPRDVNKDLTPKDQDKDKDLTPKDQDKDKDLTPKDQDKDKDLTPKDKDKDLT